MSGEHSQRRQTNSDDGKESINKRQKTEDVQSSKPLNVNKIRRISRKLRYACKRRMAEYIRTTEEHQIGSQRQDRTNYDRRPPHLRGKQIGLYYRDRAIQKKREEESDYLGPCVVLPEETIVQIENILSRANKLYYESNTTYSSEFENQFVKTLNTTFDGFLKEYISKVEKYDFEHLDSVLLNEFQKMISKDKYQEKLLIREKLPVYTKKDEILKCISDYPVVLISGDTGCGKTTQVPQFILDDYLSSARGSSCNVICTQPRRISAITVAERVAWERTEKLGETVGYQIRLQSVKSRDRGSIMYCTTGILLKFLESDPILSKVSHVILDEIHERAIDTDILLGLLKQICKYRTDLKVILMSATFSTKSFSNYFNNCKVIQVEGTLFPVEEKYLEDILEETKFKNFPENQQRSTKPKWMQHRDKNKGKQFDDEFSGYIEPYARSLRDKFPKFVVEGILNPNSEKINLDLMKDLIFHITFTQADGAILVFLPGYDSISKLHTEITKSKFYSKEKFVIYPLHSMMPTADQKAIFERPPTGVRKIIISTNIAETSITIDDVVYVINSGKIKVTDYQLERHLQTLEEKWVTLANSHQRRGRAGRVQPGICYNLYTKAREYLLDRFPTPEIVRTRLESVILNLKMLRINNVQQFFETLIDQPHETVITNSINLLKRINALDEYEYLTPLGLHLARLPLDPQVGKMILMASLFKCIDPITSVAASLSFKSAFYTPLGKEKEVDKVRLELANGTKSDHLMISNVITQFREAKEDGMEREFCYDNFLSLNTLNQLENMKKQFCELLQSSQFLNNSNPKNKSNNENCTNENLIRSIITSGFYPNVAHLRKVKTVKNRVEPILNVQTPEDGRVQFHPCSVNCKQRDFDSRFFVYYMKQKSTAVFLFDTTMVNPFSLLIFGDCVRMGIDPFDRHFISVNTYRFQSNERTIQLILRLRKGMEYLLQKKALYPSPVEENSDDSNFIKAITKLLSIEGGEVLDAASDSA